MRSTLPSIWPSWTMSEARTDGESAWSTAGCNAVSASMRRPSRREKTTSVPQRDRSRSHKAVWRYTRRQSMRDWSTCGGVALDAEEERGGLLEQVELAPPKQLKPMGAALAQPRTLTPRSMPASLASRQNRGGQNRSQRRPADAIGRAILLLRCRADRSSADRSPSTRSSRSPGSERSDVACASRTSSTARRLVSAPAKV